MRAVLAVVAVITVLGCATPPPKDSVSALPPAVPVSDPIHPTQSKIYEQLGLRVRSEDGPHLLLDKEPAFRLIDPNARIGIVPVARLHERLNRMQIDSLQARQPIVRYEVIDLEFRTQDIFYQFNDSDDNGLQALALVYTATLDKQSVPLSAKRMVRELNVGGNSEEARIAKLTVTLYEFQLQPVGVKRTSRGNTTTVDIGTEDWKVVSMERKASADASQLIGKLPVNDPSALALVR